MGAEIALKFLGFGDGLGASAGPRLLTRVRRSIRAARLPERFQDFLAGCCIQPGVAIALL